MKLYYHPVSTTSRPVVLFAAESGIDLDLEVVDLFTGAQYQPAYEAINPSHQVPVLEDGDFRLTESSSILKFLADGISSPAYPKDPKQRAHVNERMDWFNTGFYRDFSYGFLYPQIFPFMPGRRRASQRSARTSHRLLNSTLRSARRHSSADASTSEDAVDPLRGASLES